MKTANFKSKLFKAAWKIHRENMTLWNKEDYSFSDALKSAWKWAKKNLVEKFRPILSIVKESERAILCVIDQKINHIVCEMQDVTMWVPKSIIVENCIPEWFYKKVNC